jgi:hypothetical protein
MRSCPGQARRARAFFGKGADPEVFGASCVEVEVAAVALEAFTARNLLLAGGF